MEKRPTLQMIADRAGVSRGTVDRVLHDRAGVRDTVRKRVLDAVEALGYFSPRARHQQTVAPVLYPPIILGLLLPNWSGYFRDEILRGLESARAELSDYRVRVLVEQCHTESPAEAAHMLDNLVRQGAQGIALCALSHIILEQKIAALCEAGIPVITYNSDIPRSRRVCFIGQDYERSGRVAASLLCRSLPPDSKVLAAAGNLEYDAHRKRLDGFCKRMHAAGIASRRIEIIETYNDYNLTYRKVHRALEDVPAPAAVYMANGSVTGCVDAVHAAGRAGSLCVITHDVSPSTRTCLRNGSVDFTIAQDLFRQGYQPLMLLRGLLQKGIAPAAQSPNTQISIICADNL